MDAAGLIAQAHGSCLRALCASAGDHYEGLSVAARRVVTDRRLLKRLVKLDMAYQIVRHVTEPSAARIVREVVEHLAARAPDGKCASGLRADAPAFVRVPCESHLDVARDDRPDGSAGDVVPAPPVASPASSSLVAHGGPRDERDDPRVAAASDVSGIDMASSSEVSKGDDGCEVPPVSKPAPNDFAYLNKMSLYDCSKSEKVINMIVNKPAPLQDALGELDTLEKYFKDRIDDLAAFFKEKFGLRGRGWPAIVAEVVAYAETPDVDIRSRSRTSLAELFVGLRRAYSNPGKNVEGRNNQKNQCLMSPAAGEKKRRKKEKVR